MTIKKEFKQNLDKSDDLHRLIDALSKGLPDRHHIVNEDGLILARFGNETGDGFYNTDDPTGMPITETCSPELAASIQNSITEALQTKSSVTNEYSLTLDAVQQYHPRITNPKEVQWFELIASPLDTMIQEKRILVCSARNITKRKHLEEELTTLALTDPLTQLYNRRFVMNELDQAFKRYVRYSTPMSLLMIDIDHFKKINDTYGHDVGDQILVEFSQFLQSKLRNIDILGRIGGEEFLILFPESSSKSILAVAERLLAGTRELCIRSNALMISFTISAGLTEITDSDPNIDTALKRADNALYESKTNGRDQITHIIKQS